MFANLDVGHAMHQLPAVFGESSVCIQVGLSLVPPSACNPLPPYITNISYLFSVVYLALSKSIIAVLDKHSAESFTFMQALLVIQSVSFCGEGCADVVVCP